ncbi:LADA_0A07932g1_1 [Lachancea dasiensis]|uniref:LADA_0A07932g1_1 n=1 Tax=Lachancea dasiensis TaxID=1072105 RepID=A0A1G4IQ32_9SACH|nr:LADA_0A07932g1_1 [Lachancea dasiensis]
MHDRSSLQSRLLFGIPVALVAGLLTQLQVPIPTWLHLTDHERPPVSSAISPKHMNSYDLVHICHCPERSLEWRDVSRFLLHQLHFVTTDWASLAMNLLFALNVLMWIAQWLASWKKAKNLLHEEPTATTLDSTFQDERCAALYTAKERALLQFQKLNSQPPHFVYGFEDPWDCDPDELLPPLRSKGTESVETLHPSSRPKSLSSTQTPITGKTLGKAVPTGANTNQNPAMNVHSSSIRTVVSRSSLTPDRHSEPPIKPSCHTSSKLKFHAVTVPSTPIHLERSSPEKKPLVSTVEQSTELSLPESLAASQDSSSTSSHAKNQTLTPENLPLSFHQPSPAKSTILKTELTQEQVYSQPFIY